MSMRPTRFRLDETLYLAGEPFQVKGIAQIQLADDTRAIRYLLAGEGGTQILEERGERYRVLKQFMPSAAPQPNGRELSVMGVPYALGGVDQLMVLGADGLPVGAAPQAGLMLSGRFEGDNALILREFAPGGAAAQTFYTVKPLGAGEVRDSREQAELERARLARVQADAAAQAESGEGQAGWGMRIGAAVVAVLVATALAYACSAEQRRGADGRPPLSRE